MASYSRAAAMVNQLGQAPNNWYQSHSSHVGSGSQQGVSSEAPPWQSHLNPIREAFGESRSIHHGSWKEASPKPSPPLAQPFDSDLGASGDPCSTGHGLRQGAPPDPPPHQSRSVEKRQPQSWEGKLDQLDDKFERVMEQLVRARRERESRQYRNVSPPNLWVNPNPNALIPVPNYVGNQNPSQMNLSNVHGMSSLIPNTVQNHGYNSVQNPYQSNYISPLETSPRTNQDHQYNSYSVQAQGPPQIGMSISPISTSLCNVTVQPSPMYPGMNYQGLTSPSYQEMNFQGLQNLGQTHFSPVDQPQFQLQHVQYSQVSFQQQPLLNHVQLGHDWNSSMSFYSQIQSQFPSPLSQIPTTQVQQPMHHDFLHSQAPGHVYPDQMQQQEVPLEEVNNEVSSGIDEVPGSTQMKVSAHHNMLYSHLGISAFPSTSSSYSTAFAFSSNDSAPPALMKSSINSSMTRSSFTLGTSSPFSSMGVNNSSFALPHSVPSTGSNIFGFSGSTQSSSSSLLLANSNSHNFTQPTFGVVNPAKGFCSAMSESPINDQMKVEDTMTNDTKQSTLSCSTEVVDLILVQNNVAELQVEFEGPCKMIKEVLGHIVPIPVATEMDLPDDEGPDAGLSQDLWEVSNKENQPSLKNSKSELSTSVVPDQPSIPLDTSKVNTKGVANVTANGNNDSPLQKSSQQKMLLPSNGSYSRGSLPNGILSYGYHDSGYNFDGMWSSVPWVIVLCSLRHNTGWFQITLPHQFCILQKSTARINQNFHHVPHLMSLHNTRPASGIGHAVPGTIKKMYLNNHMSSSYNTTPSFRSNLYDSRTNGQWDPVLEKLELTIWDPGIKMIPSLTLGQGQFKGRVLIRTSFPSSVISSSVPVISDHQ